MIVCNSQVDNSKDFKGFFFFIHLVHKQNIIKKLLIHILHNTLKNLNNNFVWFFVFFQDPYKKVSYDIITQSVQRFSINPNTGLITLTQGIAADSQSQYVVSVKCVTTCSLMLNFWGMKLQTKKNVYPIEKTHVFRLCKKSAFSFMVFSLELL